MKHYGIWIKKVNKWMMNADGTIFWTTSLAVAEVQLLRTRRFFCKPDEIEIREF